MATLPVFAVRGSGGLRVHVAENTNDGSDTYVVKTLMQIGSRAGCRVMKFSDDGDYFAYCDGENTLCIQSSDQKQTVVTELPRTTSLHFSPKNSILCTFEPYAVRKDQTEPTLNLKLWNVKTGACIAEYPEKRQRNWHPQWSDDEEICCRIAGSEILFYESNNFDRFVQKLTIQNVSNFVLAFGPSPYHIATYVPGIKSNPCFARVYEYPNFGGANSAIANKSFFKADRAEIKWNKKGNAVMVVSQADVDKSGTSYYGEQTLYLMLTNGDSFRITLAKEGPIYSYEFNPAAAEFCAIYGYMPAKATLFNFKGEPTFDFGTGARNEIHYSPFGNLVILAGFGNLRGNVETWTLKGGQIKQVVQFMAEDTTYFHWAPDGEHVACATTSPRLRVNNGYRLIHYTGRMLHQNRLPEKHELLEFVWQPAPPGFYSCQPLKTPVKGQAPLTAAATTGGPQAHPPASSTGKAGAYVPPHMRGQAQRATFSIRDEELPDNLKKQQKDDGNVSKNALRNKKKREAKKTAAAANIPASAAQVPPSQGAAARGDHQQRHPPQQAPQQSPPQPDLELTGNAENDKKIKNISKKLQQIAALKQQQAEGKTLEANQLDKISKEDQLLAELSELQM